MKFLSLAAAGSGKLLTLNIALFFTVTSCFKLSACASEEAHLKTVKSMRKDLALTSTAFKEQRMTRLL